MKLLPLIIIPICLIYNYERYIPLIIAYAILGFALFYLFLWQKKICIKMGFSEKTSEFIVACSSNPLIIVIGIAYFICDLLVCMEKPQNYLFIFITDLFLLTAFLTFLTPNINAKIYNKLNIIFGYKIKDFGRNATGLHKTIILIFALILLLCAFGFVTTIPLVILPLFYLYCLNKTDIKVFWIPFFIHSSIIFSIMLLLGYHLLTNFNFL